MKYIKKTLPLSSIPKK